MTKQWPNKVLEAEADKHHFTVSGTSKHHLTQLNQMN